MLLLAEVDWHDRLHLFPLSSFACAQGFVGAAVIMVDASAKGPRVAYLGLEERKQAKQRSVAKCNEH